MPQRSRHHHGNRNTFRKCPDYDLPSSSQVLPDSVFLLEVAPEARAAVLSAHPRDSMKRNLGAVIRDRARAGPRTRIALLCRLGFLGLISRSPFED